MITRGTKTMIRVRPRIISALEELALEIVTDPGVGILPEGGTVIRRMTT
ncbi:unnamed protein product, partial [Allacma fusca]